MDPAETIVVENRPLLRRLESERPGLGYTGAFDAHARLRAVNERRHQAVVRVAQRRAQLCHHRSKLPRRLCPGGTVVGRHPSRAIRGQDVSRAERRPGARAHSHPRRRERRERIRGRPADVEVRLPGGLPDRVQASVGYVPDDDGCHAVEIELDAPSGAAHARRSCGAGRHECAVTVNNVTFPVQPDRPANARPRTECGCRTSGGAGRRSP